MDEEDWDCSFDTLVKRARIKDAVTALNRIADALEEQNKLAEETLREVQRQASFSSDFVTNTAD